MTSVRRLCAMAGIAARLACASAAVVPVTFEEQDTPGREPVFLTRAGGYRALLTRQQIWLASRDGKFLRITLAGAQSSPLTGIHQLPGRSNYLVGTPAHWRTGLSQFGEVTAPHVYPGIDLVWHGRDQRLEQDFQVAAGADPRRIRLEIRGAPLGITAKGDLAAGSFRFDPPRAFQDGREIACRYELRGHTVRFALGAYDHSRPLTIDPILGFSTFLGGSGIDSAVSVALDPAGNIYVAGTTDSTDFPVTAGAFQPKATGDLCPGFMGAGPCRDIFVSKLSGDGNTLLYSTYLGGVGDDRATAITVDSGGNVYLLGITGGDFPKLVPLAGQTIGHNFVAKLSPDGSNLIYATALPDTAHATALAVDTTGAVYLTGAASAGAFPIANAFQAAPAYGIVFKTTDGGNHWQGFANGLPVDLTSNLIADPRNPQVLYALFLTYGLFKSSDAGQHWSALPTGLDYHHAYPVTLGFDPDNPQVLYMGTTNDLHTPGVYKSTDGGATWVASGLVATSSVGGLAVDPRNSSTVYASTGTGLWKSTDGAATWGSAPLAAGGILTLDPTQPSTIYLGGMNGVMKSIDGGATWTTMNNGFTKSTNIQAFALDPHNPQSLYAATTINFGVYHSADGGAHWTQAPWNFSNVFVRILLVDPAVPSRVWAGTNLGLLVSNDAGATWSQTPSPFPRLSIKGLGADGAGGLYAIGNGWSEDDAFVMKLDHSGSQIVYSTYLGGIGYDAGGGIAVDAGGRAYVTGTTDSPDFPVTAAMQPKIGGGFDSFAAVLGSYGNQLGWSTYLGGSDDDGSQAIALDSAGNVHLGGTINSNRLNGPPSAILFAAKLKGDGSAILYNNSFQAGTFTNSFQEGTFNGVATDAGGNTYLASTIGTAGLPTVNPLQPGLAGISNGYVAEWNGSTGVLQFATYFGGSGTDSANSIAVDSAGDVYLAGTTSSLDFPQKYALQPYGTCASSGYRCYSSNAFVAKIATAGTGPVTRLDAVTNAASYNSMLAPGELASLWGADLAVSTAVSVQPPLSTQLSDAKVTVNGVAAPLIYVSPTQINAQIPFEIAPGPAQVQVTSTAGTAVRTVQIGATAPAIFTLNAEGSGPGAILHGITYAVVSDANPAAAGEIISIFCTGLGALSPALPTGAAAPFPAPQTVAPVGVSIGGSPAVVLFEGAAPGFAGLYQINAQVPAGLATGPQAVQVVANGAGSNIVTLAVR